MTTVSTSVVVILTFIGSLGLEEIDHLKLFTSYLIISTLRHISCSNKAVVVGFFTCNQVPVRLKKLEHKNCAHCLKALVPFAFRYADNTLH